MANDYNGWTNKETWLVNVWYMGDMPQYFADMEQFHVDRLELEDSIRYIAEECEALSKLPAGLLSDFINTFLSDKPSQSETPNCCSPAQPFLQNTAASNYVALLPPAHYIFRNQQESG